jgi:hypothetical protein
MRLFRFFMVCIMMLAVPLQGMASVVSLLCSHQQASTRAVGQAPVHSVPAVSGPAHDMHGASGMMSDASAHIHHSSGLDNDKSQGHDCAQCVSCASCGHAVAFLDISAVPVAPYRVSFEIDGASTAVFSRSTPPAKKPPRV